MAPLRLISTGGPGIGAVQSLHQVNSRDNGTNTPDDIYIRHATKKTLVVGATTTDTYLATVLSVHGRYVSARATVTLLLGIATGLVPVETVNQRKDRPCEPKDWLT